MSICRAGICFGIVVAGYVGIGKVCVTRTYKYCIPSSAVRSAVKNLCQAAATIELSFANTCHTVWYIDAGQAGAISERLYADTRHTVWYSDARQAAATRERTIVDTRHTVWYSDARQTSAIEERKYADTHSVLF